MVSRMSEQTKYRTAPTPSSSEDLAVLQRIYGIMDIDYVNIVRIEHVNKALERWPLLAECRQLAERRD